MGKKRGTYQIKDPLVRFGKHFRILENGCWQWIGNIDKITGYSKFSERSKLIFSHRYSYSRFVGRIPSGKQIDHLCRNRACVNPKHLEAVTPRENVLRGEGVCSKNAKKTYCKNGHKFTEENTYHYPDYRMRKGRGCKTCLRAARQRYREKVVTC